MTIHWQHGCNMVWNTIRNKRNNCAFCGNELPADIWKKLDNHFNQESNALGTALDEQLRYIKSEIERIPTLLKISRENFYSNFHQELDKLQKDLSVISKNYRKTLETIEKQLEERKKDVFTSLIFAEPTSVESNLNTIQNSYKDLVTKSNEYTTSLNDEQLKAKKELRLHEVYTFTSGMEYDKECAKREALKAIMTEAEKKQKRCKKKCRCKTSRNC